MSKLLQSNSYFLNFILQTPKKQALLLLQNTTTDQALVLSEIALNLLQLPLNKKEKKIVAKNKALLTKLSKKKLNKKLREKLISKNKEKVYNILKSIEVSLLKLI